MPPSVQLLHLLADYSVMQSDIISGGLLQMNLHPLLIFSSGIFRVLLHATFFRIQNLYDKYNFWIIFTAGFTPLPYKVFTISAGAFNVFFPMFVIASFISRGARFFLVAGLIWKFGPQIKSFIDKYFNILAITFTVLLIGGFFVVKYLF